MHKINIEKILFVISFIICAVMMFFIHRGQQNIIKFYDVSSERYVDIDIKEKDFIRGNFTSLHTAALGYLQDYAYIFHTAQYPQSFSEYHKEPEKMEYCIDVTSPYPFLIMDDRTQRYGYIDVDGKIVIEPQYLSASEFDENGLAFVYGFMKNNIAVVCVIDQYGNYIIDPDLEADYILISPDYKWIFVKSMGHYNGSDYWCFSLDGSQCQAITHDDFFKVCRKTDVYYTRYSYVYDEEILDGLVDIIDFGGK